jgi:hypothetical protein
MVFPQTPLPLKVELQVGSVWTDVTTDVRGEQQIRIQRGRSDWGQEVDSTRCSFTLDNNSGKYSPRNASGPYYGQIGRNTPCRVSVMTGTPYLDLPGSSSDFAETADVAALDITGDLDVRLDASFANWLPPLASGNAASVEMIGKFSGTGQKSWFLGSRNGLLYFEWSADGTNSLSASSTLPPVIPGSGRLAIRVALDVNNGASGNTVTFYTADNLDAPWTQLGATVVQAGTTSVFSSTSPVRIGNATGFNFAQPFSRVHSAEIRNGLWGTIVAQPYFSNQAVGATSFSDAPGRTWTVNGAASITNRQTRFVGEVSAWAVRWETRFDVVTQIDASGILRRLTQGASPVRSAMYRELTNPSRTGIVGYWPMEDDAGATTLASALPAQAAMPAPSSGMSLAAFSDWAASAPLPTFTFGTTKARLAPYTATNFLFARFFTQVPAGGVSGTDRLFSFTTTGTARTWSLFINTAGALALQAYDIDGTQLFTSGFGLFAINGVPRHIGIELTQSGANINWVLVVYEIDETDLATITLSTLSGTLNSNTAGAATEVRVGQDGLLNGTAVGHVAMASSSTAFTATQGAMIGWREETASGRVQRLGSEEGFPAYSVAASDQQMGPQGRSTLVDLLREAEAADEGILCEGRSYLGLRLRDRISLYNQRSALTLDYTGSSGLVTPLEPTDDDQSVRNDRTVARVGGSSSRLTLDTGPLSTQAPPTGVGRYDDSVTRNLATDDQTLDHAGWLLHVGTWDETRYPVVRLVLSKVPAMLESAAAVDIGDRIQITNPPSWLPLDTADLQVQGYSEVLDQFTWNLDFNCIPAGPWDVAWAGDASTASSPREFRWTDTTGSALVEALTTTETDVDVRTTDGPVWSPNVRDTPFDWRVAGEVMTVTAPHTLLNPNPFFNTTVNNWTAQSSTMTWSQTFVHPHPRAVGSMRIAPDGVSATGGALGDLTGVGTITPGAVYVVSAWVFSVNGWSDLQPAVNWYDSGGALISSVTGTSMSVSASVWTYLEQQFTAPANASQAKVRLRHGGTPATSDIWYVWAARITRPTSSWLHDNFGRTASSTWSLADSGQTWSTGGGTAADYNVTAGYGGHILATVNASRRTFVDFTYPDFDYYADVTTSATATGGSLFGGPTGRYLDSDNLYQARLEFTTANAILLTIRKRVTAVETQLGTATVELTHAAGAFVRVRFQASGTTLRAKAWLASAREPDVWHVTVTDSSITTSSFIGVRSVSASTTTNVNPEIRYDNLAVINPQTYTVTRSANRVVKAQSSGASVALAYPTPTAL